ncbi:MAG: thioredoxin [Bdellovibrionaceae bacterium]|nr:thioredoxin [Pseudobdellovibrionaceae bacterium]
MSTKAVTDATFETEVLKSNVPVLVDFWAEWCGPCRALAPKLEELASEWNGKAQVVKVNIDENRESAVKFGVRSIPTMILFKNGEEVEQIIGNVAKEDIANKVGPHI